MGGSLELEQREGNNNLCRELVSAIGPVPRTSQPAAEQCGPE